MTTGIILAGGRGSRLGPLAAQISKALVSIGQRPHLAHQVELLKKHGCREVIVVTSPDTDVQVGSMITRSGLGRVVPIKAVVQPKPLGPVDAIRVGLEVADLNRGVMILMSDTYLDEDLPTDGTWVAVAPAEATRSFCFESGGRFVDGTASKGKEVTVGAYRFADAEVVYAESAMAVRKLSGSGTREVGMAPFLTAMIDHLPDLKLHDVKTWMDLGDVASLARARQTKFIAREHHSLQLSSYGTLTKKGAGADFLRQGHWLARTSTDPDPRVANLVPRVFGVKAAGAQDSQYEMEFIDLPTLSELWLYWPGRADTWADILRGVTRALEPLWNRGEQRADARTVRNIFKVRATQRLDLLKRRFGEHKFPGAQQVIDWAEALDESEWVRAHGDLNFNNIMYSLNTGMVKLVDPRGDDKMPLIYELAKLRYSYHGGFSAITHGLFSLDTLAPFREEESKAMDEVIESYASLTEVTIAEALLLVQGAALHPEREAFMMVERAKQLVEDL